MKKSILYRMFGFGSVPKKLRAILEQEGIVVMDEGMSGRFITKHVNGPGKRFRGRSEGFSGSLVVTKERVICHTFGKRQMNISINDPKTTELYLDLPGEKALSVSFESSVFRKGWDGVIEFRFKTEKALLFRDAFLFIGAQQGAIPASHSSALHVSR